MATLAGCTTTSVDVELLGIGFQPATNSIRVNTHKLTNYRSGHSAFS
jgi:hypothetical protein